MNTAAKTALANKLKHHIPEFQNSSPDESEQHRKKPLKDFKYYEGSSQDYIPIRNIQDGMIITRDGRYIGVIEILPINFYQKSIGKKKSILNSFGEIFRNQHTKWGLKIMNDPGDSIELIANIRKNCPNQDDPKIKKSLEDYIQFLNQLGKAGSVAQRFFYLWEYSGLDGRKSRDPEEIAQTMWENKQALISSLQNCDNICLVHEDENVFLTDFLYTFFNRKTHISESIYDRYTRLSNDFNTFHQLTGIEKELKYSDLIAPKGMNLTNRHYITMDGQYYGFIGLSSESWPVYDIPLGWLNRFNYGAMVDIDVIGKRIPQQASIIALEQYNRLTADNARMLYRKGKANKADKKANKFQNVNDVLQHMNCGDDLYDVSIVITVRADSPKNLSATIRMIEYDLKHKCKIDPDSCYLCCEDYLRLTMPFLYITPAFTRIKHNVVSSKLSCFYPFTSSTISHPNGLVLGLTENNAVLSIDNFNTDFYENAHMMILGTTGAGKTFVEQIIGKRSFLNGRRCFFIIPKKGYEYERGCHLSNGSYVQLMPGSNDCINILEIRPEGMLDLTKIKDDTIVSHESLLAKKISSIIVWLQLLLGKEELDSKQYNRLNQILYELYFKFGITDDNNSIYVNQSEKTLKKMPILSDLYELIKEDSSLESIKEALIPFINGSCRNMNGQTNVDLNNQYIAFDCNEDIIGEKLLPAFLYIAFDFVYSVVKAMPYIQDVIFLDELWKMLLTEDCAKQVHNMIKLVRGYNGGVIVATQELKDLLGRMREFGESILNNSAVTLFLKMKPKDLELVRTNYNLSTDECNMISKFKRGEGLLISNGDKIKVRLKPSRLEKQTLSDSTS